jgi:hypothetical protein
METQAEYKTNPAGLFHAIATEPLTIWHYCRICWDRTNQDFLRDEDEFEIYRCQDCNCENKVAVR